MLVHITEEALKTAILELNYGGVKYCLAGVTKASEVQNYMD